MPAPGAVNQQDTSFGLLATTRYLPRLRLERSQMLAQHQWMAPGLRSLAKGRRAMASWDEDSATMAVETGRIPRRTGSVSTRSFCPSVKAPGPRSIAIARSCSCVPLNKS